MSAHIPPRLPAPNPRAVPSAPADRPDAVRVRRETGTISGSAAGLAPASSFGQRSRNAVYGILTLPRWQQATAAILTGLSLFIAGLIVKDIRTTPTSETKPVASSTTTTTSTPTPPPPPPPPPPSVNQQPEPVNVGQFQMTGGPAVVQGATYASMPFVLPLNPAGPQETMVRWVENFGRPPSEAETGTVYVLGHAWGAAPLVFNPISEVVTSAVDVTQAGVELKGLDGMPVHRLESPVLNGSLIRMSDEQGRAREWRVTRSWLVSKDDAIADPDVMDQDRPGRIVLIACSISGVKDLGFNVIVEGQLV